MLASIDEADEIKSSQILTKNNFEMKAGQMLSQNNFEMKSGQMLTKNNFELKAGHILSQNSYSPPQDVDLLTPSISKYQPQIIRDTLKRDAIMQVNIKIIISCEIVLRLPLHKTYLVDQLLMKNKLYVKFLLSQPPKNGGI